MKITKSNFLSLILVTLFFSIAASAADSKIIWEPGKLARSPLIGTVSSVEVTFSSDTELTNVELNVVPELAPYITVSPSSFGVVPAGVEQRIQLLITIPGNVSEQTLDGTIHLSSSDGSRRTYSRPLPVTLDLHSSSLTVIPQGVALPSSDRIVTSSESEQVIFVKDEITIDFREGTPGNSIIGLVSQIGGTFMGSTLELNSYQVRVREGDYRQLSQLVDLVKQNPDVTSAMHHYLIPTSSTPRPKIKSNWSPAFLCTTNDPVSCSSYVLPLLNLPAAWDIAGRNNTRDVGIAILDTGFDIDNDDLRNSIVITNTPRSAWDHGTQAASIVGAKVDNGFGIAGVMGNARMRLYGAGHQTLLKGVIFDMPLLRLSAYNALNNGARVINFSGGYGCLSNTCTADENRSLNDNDQFWSELITAAARRGLDVLWVFAAGNNSINQQKFSPARLSKNYPNVVSVSSVDAAKQRAIWPANQSSDYGEFVTVAAPGTDVPTIRPGSQFANDWDGTSASAPYVTGVAALMRAVNSGLTAQQIKSMILCTADDAGNFDVDGNRLWLLNAGVAVGRARSGSECLGKYLVNMIIDGSLRLSFVNFDISGPTGVVRGTNSGWWNPWAQMGTYRLDYVGGGPFFADLTGVSPSDTQILRREGQQIDFTMHFTTRKFKWLNFIEGDPRLPGDGRTILPAGGQQYLAYEMYPGTDPLFEVPNGISVAVFPAPGSPQPTEIKVNYVKVGFPPGSPCGFSLPSPGYAHVNVNGFIGTVAYQSGNSLLNGFQQLNSTKPECGYAGSYNMRVDSVTASIGPSYFTTVLDAVAMGPGPSGYPGTLMP